MVQSMTGFGKGEATLANGKLSVEIRSLNGKTADIGIKTSMLPKEKEMEVRKMIASELGRGNIDFFLTWEPNAASASKSINKDVVKGYYGQVRELMGEIGIEGGVPDVVLHSILRMPEVLDTKTQEVINEENWPCVWEAICAAIAHLKEFRAKEGAILRADVLSKVESILSYVDRIEECEGERIPVIRQRILDKFAELNLEIDKDRLEAEMIFYIEKLDINEEKVRLRQHCRYFMDTLDNDSMPGKKLGFMAQEMGREINTTGSKANNFEIQQIVVKMKDELEKIKEQSLNIL